VGGAIYFTGISGLDKFNASIISTNFTDNQAGYYGGSIYFSKSI
jgi:predicted outer membrane repeat protein